jgi:hypothetical protein
MGVLMASAYIGTTLMPPLFGRLAALTGFALFPFVVGAVLVTNSVAVTLLNRQVDAATRLTHRS